jgi:uncharacterized membrane protein
MLVASVASAAAFFIVPAIGFIIGWLEMPYLNPDGTPDNAPIRGAGIFVLISPVIFVLFTAFAFLGTLLLQHFKQLRPMALASIVTVASFGLGFVMVLDRPFGWRDALYYFVGFSGLILAALSLSALVWWKVAMRPNNTVERDGPQAARPSL